MEAVLKKKGIKVMEHPAYIVVLALCDYWAFPRLKTLFEDAIPKPMLKL